MCIEVLSVRRRAAAFAAVVAAVGGSVVLVEPARAADYAWSQPPSPPPPEGTPPSPPRNYAHPGNWTPNGIPGAGDTTTFAIGGQPNSLVVEITSLTTQDKLTALDGFVRIALPPTPQASTAGSLTLANGHLALQVGSAANAYQGTAYLDFIGGRLAVPNGSVLVSAAHDDADNQIDAALTLDGTELTLGADLRIGREGGDGFVDMVGPATATIGGSVFVGDIGSGALNVRDGYRASVGANLVIAQSEGFTADVIVENGTPGDDRAAYDTGIDVAGNVEIGDGFSGSATGEGGAGFLGVFSHTYVRSSGDWIFRDADRAFDGSGGDLYDHAHGSARNVTLGRHAYLTLSGNSRLDVSGDLYLAPDAFMDVEAGSELHVTGSVILENGAWLSVADSIAGDADVVNIGSFQIEGANEVHSFSQLDGGALLIDVRSATDFDRLLASVGASLDGLLELSFDESFTPTEGMTFDLIDAQIMQGGFDEIRFNRPLDLAAVYDPATGVVTMTAVPEPASLAVIGVPLAMGLLSRRRGRRV